MKKRGGLESTLRKWGKSILGAFKTTKSKSSKTSNRTRTTVPRAQKKTEEELIPSKLVFTCNGEGEVYFNGPWIVNSDESDWEATDLHAGENVFTSKDCKYLSKGFRFLNDQFQENITAIDLSAFNTSKIRSMECMFACCTALKTLDLSRFDTSQVKDMTGMFSYCQSLSTLDLSPLNTAKVETMNDMFVVCRSLTSLDLSCFNTHKVYDMSHMFHACSSLVSLDLSNIEITSKCDTSEMFYECESLKTVVLKNCSPSTVKRIKDELEDAGCEEVQIIS